MNEQNETAQLRFLEETAIRLRQNGFTVEPIKDQHLPVRWENHYLCRVSGRGSVLYRQENVDGIGAQDALQIVIHIAAMIAEYMTAMERAPKLQATGLHGDYRILADFSSAVLAGHPTERGVQFVTWEWDWDREGVYPVPHPPRPVCVLHRAAGGAGDRRCSQSGLHDSGDR